MTVAHVGHWLLDLVYLAPVLTLGGLVLFGKLRALRERRRPPAS